MLILISKISMFLFYIVDPYTWSIYRRSSFTR